MSGVPHTDDYIVIGYSGLSIGDRVDIPGSAITDAVRRFWRQGLYSKVQINVDKIAGDKVWLEIALQQQPRMSEMRFEGVKSGEKKDINERLGMVSGQQLTPNIIAQAKKIIENYYAKKGFKDASVKITQQPDLSKENYAILDVKVDRNNRVKVHQIHVEGNRVLSDKKVKRTFKKTNENNDILKLFSQKKFVESDFQDDLNRLIQKYNELGYRDARITYDSVAKYDDGKVDVFVGVDEGNKYYISDISWVGNTVYPTEVLNAYLGMYPGDVYNQKLGETKITVESTEVKDSVMYLKLHYADADTYRLYNEEYLFVGSVEDALSEGLSFDMIFRDADYEGEYTAADVTENKSETVAVAKEEGVIQLEKPVKYVSSNVEILDAHTVEVMPIEAEDEYAYIIY